MQRALFTLIPLLLLCACSTPDAGPKPVSADWSDRRPATSAAAVQAESARFFGRWEGLFNDGELQYRRTWVQIRLPDGTYTIRFHRTFEGKSLGETFEEGRWWIAGGCYHEESSEASAPHTYRYLFLAPDEVLMERIPTGSLFRDRRVEAE